jgi:hypothetical protein
MLIYKVRQDGVYDGAEEVPQSPVIPNGYTFSAPPAIPEGYYAMMQPTGWELVEGEKPTYPPIDIGQYETFKQNKEQAKALLSETDWTCTVDINNPQYSNPYLMNQDEFLAYRSQVRDIAINPPFTPAVFPPVPDEVWSS